MPPKKQKNDNSHERTAPLPLVAHLAELRRRLLWAMAAWLVLSGVCYFYAPQIYNFLVTPLAEALADGGDTENRRLIYTGLTEVFFSYIKLSLFGGAILAFPVIAVQIWLFIAPGLYRQEKQVFVPILILTPFLFFLGAAFLYYGVLPMAWEFFLGFESPDGTLPIQLEAKVSEYLGLVMKLIFAFGLAFQLPILLFLLAKAGFITTEKLRRNRKYAFIMIFIAAAILTPPDLISQVALAIPVLILYELSILLIHVLLRK